MIFLRKHVRSAFQFSRQVMAPVRLSVSPRNVGPDRSVPTSIFQYRRDSHRRRFPAPGRSVAFTSSSGTKRARQPGPGRGGPGKLRLRDEAWPEPRKVRINSTYLIQLQYQKRVYSQESTVNRFALNSGFYLH